jgi:hypothetical protein
VGRRSIALRATKALRVLAAYAEGVIRSVDDVEATSEVKPIDPPVHHGLTPDFGEHTLSEVGWK